MVAGENPAQGRWFPHETPPLSRSLRELVLVVVGCTFRPRLGRGVPRPKCGAGVEAGSDRCHAHRRIRDWIASLDDLAIWDAHARKQRQEQHAAAELAECGRELAALLAEADRRKERPERRRLQLVRGDR